MPIFRTRAFVPETWPVPDDILQELTEEGYDSRQHGGLREVGIRWDTHDGGGHVRWWFAEERNAVLVAAPTGYTVLYTLPLFNRKRIYRLEDHAHAFVELVKQGLCDGRDFIYDRVVLDSDGKLRTRWFVDIRVPVGPQYPLNTAEEENALLQNAIMMLAVDMIAATHPDLTTTAAMGGAILQDDVEPTNAGTNEAPHQQDTAATAEKQDDTFRGAFEMPDPEDSDKDAVNYAAEDNPSNTKEAAPTSAPTPKAGSANDPETHGFPCVVPDCNQKLHRRHMNRRTDLIEHLKRSHGCELHYARGGNADKTKYNRKQNKQMRNWMDARNISWQSTIFADGADE